MLTVAFCETLTFRKDSTERTIVRQTFFANLVAAEIFKSGSKSIHSDRKGSLGLHFLVERQNV
jgi:hypothetical protein